MCAGFGVMFYPVTVFIDTIGIYLLCSGYVPLKHSTILKALPVFAVNVAVAMVLNEIAHATGLLETDTFNMFFISPYCEPSLPVYSLVQGVVPFPFCLILYILGLTVAAYLILLAGMGIKTLLGKRRKAVAPC